MISLVILLKGKRGAPGEIRTWGGKRYQKTPDGWKLASSIHPSGYKKTQSKGSSKKMYVMVKEHSDARNQKVLDRIVKNEFNNDLEEDDVIQAFVKFSLKEGIPEDSIVSYLQNQFGNANAEDIANWMNRDYDPNDFDEEGNPIPEDEELNDEGGGTKKKESGF